MASSGEGTGCGADRAEEGKERKAAPMEGTQQDEAHGKVIQRRNQSFFMGRDRAGAAGNSTGLGRNKGRS